MLVPVNETLDTKPSGLRILNLVVPPTPPIRQTENVSAKEGGKGGIWTGMIVESSRLKSIDV